jgi:uncharacterized repeat protein (TIGR02543 family)
VASGNIAPKPADPAWNEYKFAGLSEKGSLTDDMNLTYTFAGWYADKALSIKYDFDTQITSDVTIYADWTVSGSGGPEQTDDTQAAPEGSGMTSGQPKQTDDTQATPEGSGLTSGRPKLTDKHIRYISGYPDGSVRPDNNITRSEAAAIFFRLIEADDKEAPLTASFSDVPIYGWYYQAVAYLQKHDVISGYPDGTFRPENPITRAEFAAIASRFDDLEINVPNVFNDVPAGHWAVGLINSAAAKGWVGGFPDGTFRPDEYITRAQAATLVNKMLNRRIQLQDIPEGVFKYNDITPSHWGYCAIMEASVGHVYKRKDDGYEIWDSFER